jgi:hypothetical protein
MADESVPHRLLNLVQKKGDIGVEQAAETLKVDGKTIMEMSRMLIEARILEVFYSVSGEVKLKPGREFRKALEEGAAINVNPSTAIAETNTTANRNPVDEFLQSVKKKIVEKKRLKIQQNK